MTQSDNTEILRTLVRQNETMENMVSEFRTLSKKLDKIAALDERITVLEKRDRVSEMETVAFRTKVETLSKLGWWAFAVAGASVIGHLARLLLA